MGRPGVYGRELKLSPDGHFLGCNLGFNYFAEHEQGTIGEVNAINMGCRPLDLRTLRLMGANRVKMKEAKAYIKEYKKKSENQMRMFGNTPYSSYLINPCCSVFKREIVISNNTIKDKYSKFLTCNGEYTFIQIGGDTNRAKEKLRSKKQFTEEDLLYMPDYAIVKNQFNNYGLMRGMVEGEITSKDDYPCQVCGSWGTNSGIVVLIYRDESMHTKDTGAELVEAVKKGYIACIPELHQIFSRRGCCLINLEEAYRPRPNWR